MHRWFVRPFNADFDGDQMAVHVPLSRRRRPSSHLDDVEQQPVLRPRRRAAMAPAYDMVLGWLRPHMQKKETPKTVALLIGKRKRRALPRYSSPQGKHPGVDNHVMGFQDLVSVRRSKATE
jgi:DNA-directed RNA polymerase beta' subunit